MLNNADTFDLLRRVSFKWSKYTFKFLSLKFQLSSALTYMEHLIPQLPDKWCAFYSYFSKTIGFSTRKQIGHGAEAVLW